MEHLADETSCCTAGINPDWGNRLSMCWDLIVIFALITVLLVLTYLLVLGISLIRHESLNSSVFCSGLALALVGALAVMAVQAKVNA